MVLEEAWRRQIPGVPETRVAPGVLDRLPAVVPPPWDVLVDAVLWVQRPVREAEEVLPWPLRRRRGIGVGVAGFLRYRESPVGEYREVLASPALLRGGLLRLHVPFMAVDSTPSLRSGRANWALPKSLVAFSGEPSPGQAVEARGDGWWLRASARAWGPSLPVPARFSLAQVAPHGAVAHVSVTLRGRVRPALVSVGMSPEASFTRWLRAGRHAGVVITGGRMRIPAPVVRRPG